MLNFFKKRPKKETQELEKKELTDEEKKVRQEQILEKEKELQIYLERDHQEAKILAKVYEELGVLQSELDVEASIVSLEKSFSYKPSIGEGYKILMNLYNKKRSEAAYAGDDEGIDQWMGKMDELRQIARNYTISG
ncbi:hypothetical protein [Enterococcus rivorum]|uniref:Tetratricopeptide repeat protein n=1 Tax=Enterococcus rivorum TaxID=762845 RepID=A0A1E5L0Z4_9ENTE|nr:hypothetical protein [Enterococcus rivorum]MBP2098645.1 hypothetical protein [Enterococcus rivorum]OEH83741.1 hypothetical protein BCR26_07915 [Enterococcus rivorum]